MSIKQVWAIGIIIAIAGLYLVSFYFVFDRPVRHETEIFFADRMTEAHRVLIERYNALHAGKVRVIPIDFPNPDFSTDTRKEIMARSLRGEDDGIDLLAVDVIWVQRFAKWCEPLGKYFTEEERKRISEMALRSCYHEGELLAVPLDLDQGIMYYREDLVRRMPGGEQLIEKLSGNMTWSEFLRLTARMRGAGPLYIYPASDYEGLICSYVEILLSLRPDYFNAIGFRFDTPEAKQALRLLVDLVHKYGVTPPIVSEQTEVSSYEYFIKHDGLFIRGWTTYDQDFRDAPFDRAKEQRLRKAQLPYPDGGRPSSVFGGWNLMVSKASTKKEAVIDFVKFLLSNESQEIFYVRGGYYPVISSFYEDTTYLRKYPEIRMVKELMKTGVHRPMHEEYTKYSKLMSRYLALAIKGRLTVDEALRRVNAAIESEQTAAAGM